VRDYSTVDAAIVATGPEDLRVRNCHYPVAEAAHKVRPDTQRPRAMTDRPRSCGAASVTRRRLTGVNLR